MIAEHVRAGDVVAGRMEPDTASGFLLVGAALVLRHAQRRAATRVAEALTIACLLIAMVGPLRLHLQRQVLLRHHAVRAHDARHGAGVRRARPRHALRRARARRDGDGGVSDSAGGVMARRLYPAAIAIPILLGQLTLVGETLRLYNGKFGLSLFLLTSIVVFVLLVSLTYRSLDRTDARAHAARRRAARGGRAAPHRQGAARRGRPVADRAQAAPAGRRAVASRWCRRARSSTSCCTRVSNLSLDLRPAMLDNLGLLPALVWLFERYTSQTTVKVEFAHAGLDGRMSPIVETAAFRIVQEALTNVARHAGVPSVNVRVWRDGGVAVACRSPTAARASTSPPRSPPATRAGCRACASAPRRSAARWTIESDGRGHAPDGRAALAVDARSVQDGRQRMKTQILLADDHQVIIDGLKALLVGRAGHRGHRPGHRRAAGAAARCSSSSPRCSCSTS